MERKKLRIIFMGTPDFAVPSLNILIENDYDVVGVITSTDKMGGRGKKKLIESDVKKFALQHDLNILQPKNLKSPEFIEALKALKADLQIVVAFRMLPEVVWNMPRLGTINVHGSLLPKYRGAAPINWAVINGEATSGVTTFLLQHEIDTGDLLLQKSTPIGENETAGEVYNRLMHVGADALLETVQLIETGKYTTQAQDNSLVTKAPKIFHKTCQIDFSRNTLDIHNFIRGLSPYPTAWTTLDNKKLKIFRTEKELIAHDQPAGLFVSDNKNFIKVSTLDGYVHLLDLQLEGKKRMEVKAFLNGYKLDV